MSETKAVRRPKFFIFTLLLTVLWFGVGGVLGPISGKLSDVQSNDNAEFLPANSETSKVSVILEKFQKAGGAEYLPMTLVFEKSSGTFTAADQPTYDALVQKIIAIPEVAGYLAYVDFNGQPFPSVFPNPAIPGSFASAISKDGEALVININLDSAKLQGDKGAFEKIRKVADKVQAAVDAPAASTSGYVTGVVGIFAEFAAAFAGIDGTLLLTTLGAVAIILILVYRSPVLWIFPLLSAGFSLTVASGAIYFLAKNDIIKLNGQSQGILSVLVLGAATDYALLLISRYREELRHDEDKYHAMMSAWKGTWEPIAASAGTVAVGLMCLQLSELKSNAGLGPVGAIGVLSALVVTLTFLPAFLVLFGRKVFWPFIPRFGSEVAETKGIWGKVARFVGRRPRGSWIVSGLVLIIAAVGITQLKAEGISDVDTFTNKDAKPLVGLRILDDHDLVPPATDATIVLKAEKLDAVLAAAKSTDGVAEAMPRFDLSNPSAPVPTIVEGYGAIDITFEATESGALQQQYVADLRASVRAVDGAEALVGGNVAANYDVQEASRHDRLTIIPVILLVITFILMLLLRSILAPILLVLTVVLSFAATLGVCGIVFDRVFNFPGADASFPLFAFVFLVALGIDYNIFLMTRVREESIKIGTRAGTLKALAVTGGVITSAGVVLAATFAALGILPLVFLAELGFSVAFGVLLDTLLVRSILVPALAYDLDKKIWWPSKLSKVDGTPVV